MDRAAVSRASQHGVTLAVSYRGRYPVGQNGERLPSYTVAVGCDIHGTEAQREAALADLTGFLTPASIRQIEGWLAELSVVTAGRGRNGIEGELTLTAYSARLAQYPADVVHKALLGTSWTWWPTWAELERLCDALASPRQHMIAALSAPVPDPQPQRRPATQDERARIQALIEEQFPNVPQGWRDRAFEAATQSNCMTGDA